MQIPKIVVTGGPCAGKTTFMAKASELCVRHGRKPLIVPEAATTFITGGLDPRRPEFQDAVLSHMLHMEHAYEQAALASGEDAVMLLDRGVWDIKPYTKHPDQFPALCKKHGVVPEDALQSRYAGVIFLHSAANGAEDFYSDANNNARYESLEEARALNTRTLDAWMGTTKLMIVGNRKGESFAQKIDNATAALAHMLGVPEPVEAERKFLLSGFSASMLPKNAVAVDIVQTYLVSVTKHTERVRARGINNQWTYFHTIKEYVKPGVSIEREEIITEREYHNFLVRRDTTLQVINKTRYCFDFDGQYCELDVFAGHRTGLVMLEIETAHEDMHASPPRYLPIVGDVTNDKKYSNYELAKAA